MSYVNTLLKPILEPCSIEWLMNNFLKNKNQNISFSNTF